MQNIRLKFYAIGFLMALLILVSGCATTTGNFGRLIHNDNVTQNFEDFKVTPGYQYYYSGTKTYPRAVVGISKEVTMNSKLWEPIELTSKRLHSWIWGQAHRIIKNYKSYGSNIIGPNKEHIGIWYSLEDWQQWARIQLKDGHIVQIGGPINNQNSRRFKTLRLY